MGVTALSEAKEFRSPFSEPSQRELERRQVEISEPVSIGAFDIMANDGLEVINPIADVSIGSGEENVTEQIPKEEDVSDPARKNRPYGGVILIGFAF